jgi:hypothetical protein
MKTRVKTGWWGMVGIVFALVASGCGSGGDGDTQPVPASQTQTSASEAVPPAPIVAAPTATALPLITAKSAHFSGAGNCAVCHSTDNKTALIDTDGQSVDIAADWSSTMMANAARDPFYLATVSAEVAAQPALKETIEAKCITCHAPMGKIEADKTELPYGLDSLDGDNALAQLGRDGVSCTLCHQIEPENLGKEESYSGHFEIGDNKRIYGPYARITAQPMVNQSGFTPMYGAHVRDSALCATCHTLRTPTLDASGKPTGAEFPEQMAFKEWLQSSYARDDARSCQSCHMPAAKGAIRITNSPGGVTTTHTPFSKHHFVGGNAFMLGVLKDNAAALGLTATPAAFDATIARTREALHERTARLSAQPTLAAGVLTLPVTVQNLTGHKFPTGFPSRRAWLHVKLTDARGKRVFESGAYGPDGEIAQLDAGFEPHFDRIDSAGQVQIYEAVMADTSGRMTQQLMRAASYAKDNRLLPAGFDLAAADADTRSYGVNSDANFTGGGDTVTYIVATAGFTPPFKVKVELLYQTAAPRFVAAVSTAGTTRTQRFDGMYARADKTPERVATLDLTL